MRKKTKMMIRKVSYIFLILATFFSQSSLIPVASALSDDIHYDTVSSADPSTSSIENMLSGTVEDDGKVVTDKSVTNISEDEFEIQLSALGQSYVTSESVDTGKAFDVVFVLDVSGSMEDGNPARYRNMTRAVNSAMRTISNANSENRMGIVTFSGNYDVLLQLDKYKTTRVKSSWNQLDNVNEDSFIKSSNSRISVSTDYIRTQAGDNVSSKSVDVDGGTYTQLGIAKGAQMLLDLAFDEKKDRIPVIILLSDGKPTYYSENIENPTSTNRNGNGSSTSATIGLNTIKTAVAFKNKVTASYTAANNAEDAEEVVPVNTRFYTIAMDLGTNNKFEKAVLDPSETNVNALNDTGMQGELKRELAKMTDYSYADKGYSGDMSEEELLTIFNEIATEIVSEYVLPVSVMSEYTDQKRVLTFNDTLGTGMEVKSAPKVNYNGIEYSSTSSNEESNYTQYFYNYDVTKDNGETVNLNKLIVKVYTKDNGQQEITFGISDDLFPCVTRDENEEVVRALPIRLVTKVGLTDAAVASAKTGDVFYTNDWTDSKTTATYMPTADNIYYYENVEYAEDGTVSGSDVKYVNESVSKSDNTTGTSATSLESNFSDGVVVATLGNNGKVTLVDPSETVDKTVTKVWNDNDNQDGIRPDSVEVELLMNGKDTGKTVVLSEDNQWIATFSNLKKYTDGTEIVYTVKEISEVDGYRTFYSDDTFTITNTHEVEKIDKTVTKVWDDADNQDGVRPDEVTVLLLANGVSTEKTITLNEGNDWTATFENLDKKEAGRNIDYTLEELNVSNGYASSVKVVDGRFVVTNSRSVEKVVKTAIKVWDDNNNQDGLRNDDTTVEVELYANGEATGKKATLTKFNNYRYNFENLDKYSAGEEINYTIHELTSVDGYTKTENGMTVTNKHIPEVKDIEVVKKWDDNNNQDGIRPNEIVVTLYADGVEKASKTISSDTNWETEFKNYPVKSNGVDIKYTVVESEVDKYTLTSNTINGNTITLINSYTPEVVSKTVTKVWDDNNDQDGIRPDSINVELLADGDLVETVTVTEADGWKYTFNSLPRKNNGQDIIYTVRETSSVSGYEATYSKDTFTITNTHVTETTSKKVTKVWVDEDNIEGFRPDSIEVELLDGNNEVVRTETLSASNGWIYEFSELPKKSNGQDIIYTVREKNIDEHYTVSYDQENLVITNTRDVERTSKTVSKIWNDSNNQDGIRPDVVTVYLKANGEVVKTITLSEENNWSSVINDLEVYKNGDVVTYTIEEEEIANYTASYSQDTLTVTNTHDPYTKSITINKKWIDNNNQDGIRPGSIKVYLMANGSKVSEVTLSEDNNWSSIIDNLPVNKDGQVITYTLLEENVASGYTVSYEYGSESALENANYTVINIHEVEKMEVTLNKVWNDGNNSDGLRSEEIKVNLLRNGVFYQTISLNEANQWRSIVSNLDKNENGELIKYTLEEITKIDGYETTYSDDTFTIVNSHRILTITKIVDNEQANPGDTLTYTIIVSNDGDCIAKDVVVTDTLDFNLEFVSSDGIYDEETRVVTYAIPAIMPNEKVEFKIVVYVKEGVANNTVIKNTAVILGNENDEEVTSNEVTTLVEEPLIGEVVVNPDTSDNIYIVYITLIASILLLGFSVLKKRA